MIDMPVRLYNVEVQYASDTEWLAAGQIYANTEVGAKAMAQGFHPGLSVSVTLAPDYMQPASSKDTWFCTECGGFDILHDAVAKWDADTEEYKVVDVQDATWCHDCLKESGGDDNGSPTWGIPGEEEEEND